MITVRLFKIAPIAQPRRANSIAVGVPTERKRTSGLDRHLSYGIILNLAPIAQLDRAPVFGTGCCRFNSCWAQRIIIMVSLLFTASNVFAETITLKSGKKIEGEILEKTNEYIKVKFDNKEVYYELKYIQSIEENKVEPSSKQPEPETQDAVYYLKEGLRYGSEAKFKEAAEEFQKGLKINPSDYNLKEALKMTNDLSQGRINSDYAVYLFKGSRYLMDANYQEAIKEFQQALKLQPEDPDLNYYLGTSYYSLEEYQNAIDYLHRAWEKKPDDDEINYYLGASHYSLANYEDAINYLKKAVDMNPDDAQAYAIIGASYYSLGQNEQAKENFSYAQQLFQKTGDYLKAKDIEDFLSGIN